MSKKLALTLACGDYEIIRALKEGTVRADGIELTIVTTMDSSTRHWRFLRNREFDVAEVSSSSYLLARDQGLPFAGIPVFLHRRFRHGFAFVNTSKGINEPKDLIGRRIGVKSFQVSAILWLRGILEHEYGVPHKSIEWVTEIDEDVEFTAPEGLRLSRMRHDQTCEDMLVAGELDAVLHADLIWPMLQKHPAVKRLWPDYKSEELAYFRKTNIFPIMHVMGIKQEIVDQYPWVPVELQKAFDASKAVAMKRMENPRIVPLAWYREAWEEQEAVLGPDPWEYGMTDSNRHTLETLVGYSFEQGMIKRRIGLEELFLEVSQGRKRGTNRI
ncbi:MULTISPECIES: ABC transporter substrate-binding protein [unclassified Beijerinckia]|uniref:ABC transporter substrate-binding protein n=1 Tax=unclassified Beijerinckia TaxID=2638183 RepID=UPI00089A8885|nr:MULTISPECIES: ABC transporter substrate-binding protein [unclassified Beijerinckia]MDH7797413.1 4,5-dihydroxyphthalate decarboxylase [Beijerinckia sp. GAS462]SEC84485.1 4,5-dihydroxyphthalate decarboxylase [Beijerinckia sp. 28-YEA-48]